MTWEQTAFAALWLTAAILAGGYARTRNRSAWTWFLLTFFLGPFGAYLLVASPPREAATASDAPRRSGDIPQ